VARPARNHDGVDLRARATCLTGHNDGPSTPIRRRGDSLARTAKTRYAAPRRKHLTGHQPPPYKNLVVTTKGNRLHRRHGDRCRAGDRRPSHHRRRRPGISGRRPNPCCWPRSTPWQNWVSALSGWDLWRHAHPPAQRGQRANPNALVVETTRWIFPSPAGPEPDGSQYQGNTLQRRGYAARRYPSTGPHFPSSFRRTTLCAATVQGDSSMCAHTSAFDTQPPGRHPRRSRQRALLVLVQPARGNLTTGTSSRASIPNESVAGHV